MAIDDGYTLDINLQNRTIDIFSMEFLLFLSKTDTEIIELIKKAGYNLREDTLICIAKPNFFGAFNNKLKEVLICTKNIKRVSGYYLPKVIGEDNLTTKKNIRETIRHEATHVAQACNGGKPILNKTNKALSMNDYRKDSAIRSANLSGRRDKETEAYWMETRPISIKKALEKYCL